MELYRAMLSMLFCGMVSLFAHGATGQNETELMEAVRQGNQERVRILLNAGVNPNYRGHMSGCSSSVFLLEAAILSSQSDIVRLLIGAGANVNYKNQDGYDLLRMAVCTHNPEAIRLLIAAGADVNYQNNKGHTPLSQARNKFAQRHIYNYRHTSEIIRRLLEAGARPSTWTTEECYKYSRLSWEQEGIVVRRRALVQQWFRGLEDQFGLPRDVSRLIGTFAGLSESENLPKPFCKT